MRVLNLYCGLGGNRKLWKDVDVTAVEHDWNICKIYHDFFPEDKIIEGDAHKYLLEHFKEFDFIWSSRPCTTHSIIRAIAGVGSGKVKPVYPDMGLYEEIIFLKHFFKGKFCVENVVSYYKPLIKPRELCRHYFWTNFHIGDFKSKHRDKDNIKSLQDFTGFRGITDKLSLRNCVEPELGLHILNESKRDIQPELFR